MSPFDPSQVVEVAKAVSIRDLVRSPGSLISEVENDGAVVALARNGRIVALLTPLPERIVVEFDGPPMKETARIEVEEIEGMTLPERLSAVRNETESILLRALEYHPLPLPEPSVLDPHNKVLLRTLMYLEIEEFIERRLAGDFLTPKGMATARAIKRLLDTDQRPAPS